MKAASIVFNNEDYLELSSYERLAEKIKSWFELCREHKIDMVVLPALLGCLFDNGERYLKDMVELSNIYKGIAICPGSYYESDSENTYHSSCIILKGEIIMEQRQIYLAKWEKGIGLSRGTELNSISLGGMRLGIIISTDVFYPQVSRALALSGVELVLAPTAIKGSGNMSRQLAGLWQNVQANLFFGMESSFKGQGFQGSSIIHAPLDMTAEEDGFLALEGKNQEGAIITAELDNEKRKEAVRRFNTLGQLNIEVYKDIFIPPQNGGYNE
jgi:predicted amidohydrolase